MGTGPWVATGSNLPALFPTTVGGVTYDIFAQAVDAAGNVTPQPGTPPLPGTPTVPPTQSSYIEIVLKTPAPVSVITSPVSIAYLQPNNVVLEGTVTGATTVQVLIQDCALDPTCAAPSLYWNGSAFVSTSGWTNNGYGYFGYVGVTSFSDGTNWQMSVSANGWIGNQYYKITSLGLNVPQGLSESGGPSATFVIDNTAPSGAFNTPDTRLFLNSLPTLSATATDIAPGIVQSVVFHVLEAGTTQYWNWQSSTFTAASSPATDLTATFSSPNWTYTTSYFQVNTGTGAWENDHSYVVQEVMTDTAGNGSNTPLTHAAFTFDIIAPTSTIVVPANGLTYVTNLPSISGTANDNHANASDQIAIYSPTDGGWFDGTSFSNGQSTPSFVSVTTSSSNATLWTYAPSNFSSKFHDHQQYTIVAQATDVAGNSQQTFVTGTSSKTIIIDQTPPIVTFTPGAPPVAGFSYMPTQIGKSLTTSRISGTASDPGLFASGVSQVQVQFSYVSLSDNNTYYWDPTIPGFSSFTVTANTAWYGAGTSWNYGKDITWPTDTSHVITLQARGIDNALQADGTPGTGNISTPISVNFNLDFVAPSGTITVPVNGQFLNGLSTISGTAADDLAGVGAVNIELSSGTGGTKVYWNGSAWTAGQAWNPVTHIYPSSWTYTNPALLPDKLYDLRLQVIDQATANGGTGNIYVVGTTTFTYDTTAPNVAVTFPANGGFYSQIQVSTPFAGTASDPGSNPSSVSTVTLSIIDIDSGTYFNGSSFVTNASTVAAQGTLANWTYNSPNFSFINDHRYTVTAKALDVAGNTGTSSTVQFVYDIQAPTSTVTSPAPGYVTSWSSISGTVSDKVGSPARPSGVSASGVQVAVEQLSNNKWWNSTDSAFDGTNPDYSYLTVVNTTTTPINTWTTTLPTGAGSIKNALTSSTSYYIVSLSTDIAGNTEFGALASNIPVGVGTTVTYDTAPTAVITLPVLASTSGVISLSLSSGTASGDVGVSNVQFAVQNMISGFWMASDYSFTIGPQSNPNFIPVTSLSGNATSWAFAPAGLANNLTGNQKYLLVAEAVAPSNLTQNTFTVGVSSVQVIIDTAPPNITISFPSPVGTPSYKRNNVGNPSGNPGTGLTGTINEPLSLASGVKDFQFRLSYLSGGNTFYYTGSSSWTLNVAATAWVARANGSGAWSYPFNINWPASPSFLMKLEVRGEDNALSQAGIGPGNLGVPSTVGTDIINFNLDDVPPQGAITWPSANAAVSSATVNVVGTATDDQSGVGTTQIEVSTGQGGTPMYWNGSSYQSGQIWITTTTANPWSYTISSSALASGNLYYLRTQLTDAAGNVFTSLTSTFTYNTTAPTVVINPQAPNNVLYSADQVSTPLAGTANPSGTPLVVVTTVTLSLRDITVGTSYYNGSSWQNGSASFAAQNSVANWTYNNSALSFVNDHQYQLTATALDSSGVSGNTSFTFVYDVQAPTSTITAPAPGYFTAAPLATISGKANDKIGSPNHPSGLAATAVSVAIQQVGGSWWDGSSAFDAVSPVYSTAAYVGASSGTWSYSVPAALQNAFTSGNQYFIVSRSTDNAGNAEFTNIPAGVGITVTYDTAPPTAVITLPVLASTSGVISLSLSSGTASGDVGVSNVQFAVQNMISGFWMASDYSFTIGPQSNPNFIPVTSLSGNATSWAFAPAGLANNLTGNQKYLLVAEAVAPSNLTQNTFTVGVSSVQVIIDTAAPNITISFPSPIGTPSYKRNNVGNPSGNPGTGLTGTINEPLSLASGVKDFQFRLSYLSGGNTFYYTGSSSWTLNVAATAWVARANGSGAWSYPFNINWPASPSFLMKLEVRGEDNALSQAGIGPGNLGVPSTVGTDIINFNLDDVPPHGAITWPGANAAVSSATVNVVGTATDDQSGVGTTQIEVSTGQGGTPMYWNGSSYQSGQIWITTTTANPWSYTISSSALASGNLYYLRTQLTDAAGNVFTSLTSTFTYNTTAPTVVINPQAPNNGFYSAVQVSTPFAGTANPSGTPLVVVTTVTLSLRDITVGTSYYNGSSWQNGSASFAAQNSVANWTYNNSALSFVNDHQYQLTATALDSSGVSGNTSLTFVYDVQAPTSTITAPAPGYFTAAPLTSITGKANDRIGGPNHPSGLASTAVSVAIQQVGGNWWDGSSAFGAVSPVYSTAAFVGASSGTWSYSVPAALQNAFTSGNQYFIVSRSTDNAGNAEFTNIPAGVGITVTYDTAPRPPSSPCPCSPPPPASSVSRSPPAPPPAIPAFPTFNSPFKTWPADSGWLPTTASPSVPSPIPTLFPSLPSRATPPPGPSPRRVWPITSPATRNISWSPKPSLRPI